jgi:hypothetical protein
LGGPERRGDGLGAPAAAVEWAAEFEVAGIDAPSCTPITFFTGAGATEGAGLTAADDTAGLAAGTALPPAGATAAAGARETLATGATVGTDAAGGFEGPAAGAVDVATECEVPLTCDGITSGASPGA